MPALSIARANSIKTNNIVLRQNLQLYMRLEEEKKRKRENKIISLKKILFSRVK
jgi:hypothetical protein